MIAARTAVAAHPTRWRSISYRARVAVGVLAGLLAMPSAAAARDVEPIRLILAAAALTACAIVGARGLYVLRHRSTFARDPARVVRLGDSGMSIFGGLIAAIAGGPLIAAILDVPFWHAADVLAIYALVAVAGVRVACAVHGCCHGRYSLPLAEAGFLILLALGCALPSSGGFLLATAAYASWRLLTNHLRDDQTCRRSRLLLASGALAASIVAFVVLIR